MGNRDAAGERAAPPPDGDARADGVLWEVIPPPGVRLLESRPSRTGEGGQGLLARYSDGTTASAMVNSDGSVRVLFFRGTEIVPALPVDGSGRRRFTWERP